MMPGWAGWQVGSRLRSRQKASRQILSGLSPSATIDRSRFATVEPLGSLYPNPHPYKARLLALPARLSFVPCLFVFWWSASTSLIPPAAPRRRSSFTVPFPGPRVTLRIQSLLRPDSNNNRLQSLSQFYYH